MDNSHVIRAIRDYQAGRNTDDAAAIIYEATRKAAFVTVKAHCSNKNEQEDILQKTYMEVFLHLKDLQDENKISYWVNQIAARMAMRHSQQLHTERYADYVDEDGDMLDIMDERPQYQPDTAFEIAADHKAVHDAMYEALDALPAPQGDAVKMVDLEEMSIQDAAAFQGVSVSTFKSRLFHGRKKLEGQRPVFLKYGVELGAVPVVLFISTIFHQDVYAAEQAGLLASAGIAAGTAKVSVAAKAGTAAVKAKVAAGTGAGVAKAAGAGIGVKIAVGAVAAAVAIGGGAVAVSHRNSQADITTTVYESQTNSETSAVITTNSEQTEISPHYITLYDYRLNDGDDKESYTYTYQYEFTEDGKIAKLTKPSSYRHGKGISGYQITEYDDHENELIVTDLDDDGKMVTTYRNEYNGDLLIGWTTVSDDGLEATSRQEFNESGKRVFKYDGLLNRESTYEWTEDGNIAKATTKYLNTENDSMVVEYDEYQLDDDRNVISYFYTQTDIRDGSVSSEKAYSVEHIYDESKNWRKRLHYKSGELDHIYIQVSQQYLFEHPDAAVPTEFDFHPTTTAELYTIEELEAMAGGNNSAIEDSSEDNEYTSNLPAVDIGPDTPMKHITINGVELRLPMPVTDFLATGLELNGGRDYVEEDHYVIFETPVEGGTLEILVSNPYHGFPKGEADWMDCYVAGVRYDSSICNGEGFQAGNGLTGQTVGDALGPILGASTSYYDYVATYETDDYRIVYDYTGPDEMTVRGAFILFFIYGGIYGGENSIYTLETETETTVVSETESTLNIIEETASIVSEDNMSSESELFQDGTYYSSDGQMVCFDFAEMIVVITGYGEEGKYTSECPFYWTSSTTARRDIYNSIGEPVGYQDYIPSEEVYMTVATYNLDGVLIGSFLDGEFRFEPDE